MTRDEALQRYIENRREWVGLDSSLYRYFAESFREQWQPHRWQRILCDKLEAAKPGDRILIHAPPRYGKSVIVSQRYPAWYMLRHPTARVALACYNETHAGEFGAVMQGLLHEAGKVRKDASAFQFSTPEREAVNDGQPSFIALGLNSGFTGKGADLLIIDDPYKGAEEAFSEVINARVDRWWTQTAKPRVLKDAIVVVMFHRYHADDFAARRIAEGGWQQWSFPAIADGDEHDPTGRALGEPLSPMRSIEELDAIREEDPLLYLGQYQGKPRPEAGAFFERDWFTVVDQPPNLRWVRAWDLALTEKETSDYTAGAKVGVGFDGTLYIADVRRVRMEWPKAQDLIAETMEEDGPQVMVGIESTGFQLAAVQDLFSNASSLRVPLTPIAPKGKKKERASPWAARARYGKVALVRGPWNQAFIAECLEFPLGKHDDQVDAVSLAVELLYRQKGGELTQAAPPPSPYSLKFVRNWANPED